MSAFLQIFPWNFLGDDTTLDPTIRVAAVYEGTDMKYDHDRMMQTKKTI